MAKILSRPECVNIGPTHRAIQNYTFEWFSFELMYIYAAYGNISIFNYITAALLAPFTNMV